MEQQYYTFYTSLEATTQVYVAIKDIERARYRILEK